jgi:hypothetical protein
MQRSKMKKVTLLMAAALILLSSNLIAQNTNQRTAKQIVD